MLSAQNHANLVDNFVRSVQRAEPALNWIREQSAIVDDMRQKRHASSFDRGDGGLSTRWSTWDDDQDDNDDGDESAVGEESWYNNFRQMECKENAGAYCSQYHGDAVQVEVKDPVGNGEEKVVDWFETYKVRTLLRLYISIHYILICILELWQ